MAIVILNKSNAYVAYDKDGELKETLSEAEAEDFCTLQKAIEYIKKTLNNKVTDYYVFDTVTKKVCYRWEANKKKKKEKKNRKIYSKDTKRLIYERADGRCELCGRKILFENMSLDHVKPLSMGGFDTVDNLASTCEPCNFFKGNILPDTFFERISLIYLYQMEKKYRGRLKWKIVHRLLTSLIQSN